jgi:DNA (cytosine-5)-methyltransferase 1
MPCLTKVEIIAAGVPCQDVSVAGKRRGLAGERTGLFYDFARLLRELRPAWVVFENVPGLLSSNRGRDFAEVLRVLMVECGYGVSWRVLDSRFFGVAQRRRRLFIVGCRGKPCPAEILFEPSSGERDFAESRKAGQSLAYSLAAGSGGSKFGSGRDRQDTFVSYSLRENSRNTSQGPGNFIANSITKSYAKGADTHGHGPVNLIADSLSAGSFDASHSPGRRREDDTNLVSGTIGAGQSGGFRTTDLDNSGVFVAALTSTDGGYSADRASSNNYVECQETNPDRMRDATGLPEGMDSARYRALGNAVTVQVAEWIARRITAVCRKQRTSPCR